MTMKTKNDEKSNNIHQLNIKNITLGRGCKTALRKIKEPIWGNIVNAIECGDWWIPFDSYEYRDIKEHLETKVFHEFYDLPNDVKIIIKDFSTPILSFHKGH